VSRSTQQDGTDESPYAEAMDWGLTHDRGAYEARNKLAVDGHAPPNSLGKSGPRTARRREATCMDAQRILEDSARNQMDS
jgi:hypothetical protein